MKRREFLTGTLRALPIAFVATRFLTACGSSSGAYGDSSPGATPAPSGGGGTCAGGANTTYVNPGHAHSTVSLTKAQVMAAVPGDYTLLSGSHSHTFNMTAVDFTTLQAGMSVTSKPESDGFNHGHLVTIVCA